MRESLACSMSYSPQGALVGNLTEPMGNTEESRLGKCLRADYTAILPMRCISTVHIRLWTIGEYHSKLMATYSLIAKFSSW